PLAAGLAISDLGRPRSREDVGIVDGELELETFAAVIEVNENAVAIGTVGAAVFLFILLESAACGLVIDKAVALDHMHGRALGRAVRVSHGDTADLDADGVDDQRVAFIVTNGVARPSRRHARGM